jgi:hypothetical protein
VSLSGRELDQLKREEAGGDYPVRTAAPKEGTYEWVNPGTGEIIDVPKGIDPGWAYNPGKEALDASLAVPALLLTNGDVRTRRGSRTHLDVMDGLGLSPDEVKAEGWVINGTFVTTDEGYVDATGKWRWRI